MIDITVIRGAGDRELDTITEPLLATEAAALARGTQEMDAHAHSHLPSTYNVVYRDGVRCGQLVSVFSYLDSIPRRGKITGVSIQIDTVDTGKPVTLKLNIDFPG